MKTILYLFFVLLLISCSESQKKINESFVLNGDEWTFRPIKIPFYGYELDAEGRWKAPNQSHKFITDAINDSLNVWDEEPVRVPMSWSSTLSDPGEKEAKGDYDFPYFWQYVHKGEYIRSFDLPATFSGKRIKLDFSSVNFACWIYVNGQLVKADGGDKPYTHLNKLPFTVDITDAVKAPSQENELKIVVHDFSYAFDGEFPNEDHPNYGINYPLGDRCDYYNKDRGWRNIDSGIIGDVVLKSVPIVNVDDVFIKTNVKESKIMTEITIWNQSQELREVIVGGSVSNWKDGKKVFDLKSTKTVSLEPNEIKSVILSEVWIDPQLWWPYDPHLYNFNVTINKKVVHRERFGFRQVKVVQSNNSTKRGFYLNGIKVRLMGESMEPTWKDGYSEGVSGGLFLYNPEYWSYLIDVSKGLNINVLRTHRGMSIEGQFEIADEKGMMMIAESTINNGNHRGGNGKIENQQKAIRDLIKTHRNHPSIVFWSLANETPYQKEWEEEALKYDDTRPLTATQLSPRSYPSENIVTTACAYSMGLDGYESDIYNRHDMYKSDKLLYVYEDNACYDQPLTNDRIGSVQKGLSIFRGHRTSGYEMIFTFYTLQKLFGQPQNEQEQHLKINWSEEDVKKRGYRPNYAVMPLLDPWSNPEQPRIINPILGLKDNPTDFWKRTYSPIAVFDYEYDKRTNINASANPYIAAFSNKRILTIHNDDIQDTTTRIEVKWQAKGFDDDQVISEGNFSINVPLASVKKYEINISAKMNSDIRVIYKAFKSGKKRFEETIYLSKNLKADSTAVEHKKMTEKELSIYPISNAVNQKGFSPRQFVGSISPKVLSNATPQIGDYVQFNPWIIETGYYNLFIYVPKGTKGKQKVAIQHDTHNTEMDFDFTKQHGWVKLNKEPIKLQAGKFENNIKIMVSNTKTEVVIDALKITKMF
jgi:hypothetical protein